MILGLAAQNDVNGGAFSTMASPATVTMAWANVYLNDRYAPSMPKPPDQGWTDDGSATHQLPVTAHDDGLGVDTIELSGDGITNHPLRGATCYGHPQLSPCPSDFSPVFLYQLAEGINTLHLLPKDIVDNYGEMKTWTERLDTRPPVITRVGGSLFDRREDTSIQSLLLEGIVDRNYRLEVDAEDGNATTAGSGVKAIEIKVDGVSQRSVGGYAERSCAGDNCPPSLVWDVDADKYIDGEHTVTIEVVDQVRTEANKDRHTTIQSFKMIVNRPANEDGPATVSASTDTVGPAAASDIALSDFDPNTGKAEITWEPGGDPDLAADSPGSGIERQEVRTRKPGEAWTAWGVAVDDAVQIAGLTLGTNVDVEVRAFDENGNISASVTGGVTVANTSGPDDDAVVRAPVGPGSGQLTYNVDLSVDGQAADPDDGFRVELERPDGSHVIDETRADGTALFNGLVPGTYTVRSIGLSDEPGMVTRSQAVQVGAGGQVQARAALDVEDLCVAFADSLDASLGFPDWIDGFKQDFCLTLTDAEKLFCLRHPRLCYFFKKDAAKAYAFVPELFDTERDGSDATKANSFQHSYWTARMVRTVIKTTILDHVDYALDYATAHESEARTSEDPVMRARSAMDRHNNQVGFDYAYSRAKKHNNTFLCNRMRAKVKLGRIGARKARVDQLYWLRRTDRDEDYVHLRETRCENAPDVIK